MSTHNLTLSNRPTLRDVRGTPESPLSPESPTVFGNDSYRNTHICLFIPAEPSL